MVGARYARQSLDVSIGVPDFDLPFVDAHADTLAFQPAGHAITVAAHTQNSIVAYPDVEFTHLWPGLYREWLHRGDFFGQPLLPPGIAPVHDAKQEGFVDFDTFEVAAAAQEQVLFHRSLQSTVG